MEQEINKQIQEISKNVAQLNGKAGSKWAALFNGFLGGLGYAIGFAVAVALLGYLLNAVGVIPAFRNEVNQWKQIIEQTQKRTPIQK